MSKEPSVFERLTFVGRNQATRDKTTHQDSYRVTGTFQGKQLSGAVQRNYHVFKRDGKTLRDKRSGSWGSRFANRRNDPQRSPKK